MTFYNDFILASKSLVSLIFGYVSYLVNFLLKFYISLSFNTINSFNFLLSTSNNFNYYILAYNS